MVLMVYTTSSYPSIWDLPYSYRSLRETKRIPMKVSLRSLILLGVVLELAIFLISYLTQPSIEETFRYAARYSGRLSAIVFLGTFYLFVVAHPAPAEGNRPLRNFILLFAVLHGIHFGFLATNVLLNAIPLEAHKLAGGALAYIMILAAPFQFHKINFKLQLLYFYYVSFVMIMTYVARVKGDFQGAQPSLFHYVMMGILLLASVLFGWRIARARPKVTSN